MPELTFAPDQGPALHTREIHFFTDFAPQIVLSVLDHENMYDADTLAVRRSKMIKGFLNGHTYIEARGEDDFNGSIVCGLIHAAPLRHLAGMNFLPGLTQASGVTVKEAGIVSIKDEHEGVVAAALLYAALNRRAPFAAVNPHSEAWQLLAEKAGLTEQRFTVGGVKRALIEQKPWLRARSQKIAS